MADDPGTKDSLEAWLKGEPPETAMAIAGRAALRAVPTHLDTVEKDPETGARNLLDLLLKGAEAVTAARFPELGGHLGLIRKEAENVVKAAAFGADDEDIAAYADITRLREGLSPADLVMEPLWPDGTPDWASRFWGKLKAILEEEQADWQVWTDWYDKVLTGRIVEDRDEARCRLDISARVRSYGPSAVNREIRNRLEARRAGSES